MAKQAKTFDLNAMVTNIAVAHNNQPKNDTRSAAWYDTHFMNVIGLGTGQQSKDSEKILRAYNDVVAKGTIPEKKAQELMTKRLEQLA